MTPLQSEQLRFAILFLMMREIFISVAEREINRGRDPQMAKFLGTQIEGFAQRVRVLLLASNHAEHLLPSALSAFPDTRILEAEIQVVAEELASNLEAILVERRDLDQR